MDTPLFAGLPPEQVSKALALARRRSFGRGEVVFHEGDEGDSLHVVRTGHFVLRAATPDGAQSALRVFGPGEFIGRVARFASEQMRRATITALEAGTTYEFRRREFELVRSQHPRLNDAIILILGRELEWVSVRLLEQLHVEADRRVRRRLLELATSYGGGDPIGASVTITQEDLAGLAGTSRATVNRVLNAEVRQGTIKSSRGVFRVLDAGTLALRAR